MRPEQLVELAQRHRAAWGAGEPFVLGIMGAFSNRPVGPDQRPVAERRFHDVRLETLDAFMAHLRPVVRVHLPGHGDGTLTLDIAFHRLADFEPDALLARVSPLRELAAAVQALPPGAERERLIGTLFAHLRALLQAEPLREMEARWRSLHQLLLGVPDMPSLQVRVLDLSQAEFGKIVRMHIGIGWDQSPLFNLVVRDEVDTWGGRPFSILLGDYAVSHTAEDASYLRFMAAVAEAGGCVFVAGAAPHLLGLASYAEIAELREPSRLFEAAAYASWRALRADPQAAHVALVLPRRLVRAPHRCAVPGIGEFVEEQPGASPVDLPWAHAIYALGLRLLLDLALRNGRGGLPDAPTGGVVSAGDGRPGPRSDVVEGRFAPGVAQELEDLGLIAFEQTPGSLSLRYGAARSLAAGHADYLVWTMLCGRLMHGLRDLTRHLRGVAWTEAEHRQLMTEWLRGFGEAAPGEVTAPDAPLQLVDWTLRVRALVSGGRAPTDWSQLAVELQIQLPSLGPGSSEHGRLGAVFAANGIER